MALYIATLSAGIILQTPGDGFERVVDRQTYILVGSFPFQALL